MVTVLSASHMFLDRMEDRERKMERPSSFLPSGLEGSLCAIPLFYPFPLALWAVIPHDGCNYCKFRLSFTEIFTLTVADKILQEQIFIPYVCRNWYLLWFWPSPHVERYQKRLQEYIIWFKSTILGSSRSLVLERWSSKMSLHNDSILNYNRYQGSSQSVIDMLMTCFYILWYAYSI